MTLKQLLINQEGTILDVRTTTEYQSGHVAGSYNIPVNELLQRLDELSELKQPLILCCASGGRSAMATYMLKEQKFECIDAGSWHSITYLLSQKN
ncbi:MAG: rhodanese-like domain-containing protein [Cyclobacteriaceae bacterium]|nr:rhodanese-like domain-containing protein [Cyclobacteriaceae bacterium]